MYLDSLIYMNMSYRLHANLRLLFIFMKEIGNTK